MSLAWSPTCESPISPSISALGTRAATESTIIISMAPDLTRVSAISRACSPLSGKLWTYLADLNEQAQNRLERMIDRMKAVEGITEALKASDPMIWVQSMNNIRARAEEIILQELIYREDAT